MTYPMITKAMQKLAQGRKVAEQYLDDVAEYGAVPCEHGHLECALNHGGACSDEVASGLHDEEAA